LRYVQVIHFVDVFGDAFIEFNSRHRSHQVKIGWLPLTLSPDDTLWSRTFSRLSILQERFHPCSLAALGTSCNDACKWVLQDHRSHTCWDFNWYALIISMGIQSMTLEVTVCWKYFGTYIARKGHVHTTNVWL
jgi:hypothetical protein